MHILLFFIDGLGLGDNDPITNPLVTANMPALRGLLGGRPLTKELGGFKGENITVIPTDVSMGVAGIPQSATGQTALFTGMNAAKAIDTHLHAFPTQRLREILAKYSILKQVKELGFSSMSANAYTPDYFALVEQRKRKNSASTLAILAADIPLNLSLAILREGNAVYQDLTNDYLRHMGYEVPLISPEQAGINLAGIVRKYNFTLFEYFQTDMAGHKKDRQRAEEILENVDRCLGSLLKHSQQEDTLIVISSDHGNIEDLSRKTHTHNLVPTILIGMGHDKIADMIHEITDITPALLSLLNGLGGLRNRKDDTNEET